MMANVLIGDHSNQPADLFDSLLNASYILCNAEEPERTLGEVAACVGKAISARDVVILLFSDNSETLRACGVYGNADHPLCEQGATFSGTWISGERNLIVGKRPVFLDSGLARALALASNRALEPSSAATCLFPITARGVSLGILLASPGNASSQFNPAHIRLCQTVSNQIAAVLSARRPRSIENRPLLNSVGADLVQLVLDGKGLPALMEALEGLIGNPVVVASDTFHLLGHSPKQGETDRHRKASLEQGGVPRDVLIDPAVRRQYQLADQHRTPLTLASFPEHGWVQRRMQAPLWAGSELLGRVTVAEAVRPFKEADYAILSQATVALALELMRQRAALETEYRLKSDFLGDLLSGEICDRQSIIARAGFLGIDLLRPWDLLALDVEYQVDRGSDSSLSELAAIRRRVLESARYVAKLHNSGSVAVMHGLTIVVLIPASGTAKVRSIAEAIQREACCIALGAAVSVGVGETCKNVEDFAMSYAHARRALDLVKSLGRSNVVTSLDDLGVYGMLFRTQDPGELLRFADRMLAPLLEYDLKHAAALLETLRVYLEENCNHRKTAERLNIHINTLSGRLQRIKTIGNLDLTDSETRLNLHLAFRVLDLAGRGRTTHKSSAEETPENP